jgi:hypothetical protein
MHETRGKADIALISKWTQKLKRGPSVGFRHCQQVAIGSGAQVTTSAPLLVFAFAGRYMIVVI